MKKTIPLILAIITALHAYPKKDPVYFWGKQNAYINGQTYRALSLVDEILAEEPPAAGVSPSHGRQAALMLVDAALHDARMDSSEVVAQFMDMRMERVLEDLARPLTKGGKVYRLYNSGTIVRTPEVTIAWDIYRGPRKFKGGERRLLTDSVARVLVENCDIMFLTHNHSDHVDPDVIRMFLDAGKPVVAPDEILPQEKRIIHVRPEKIASESFTAANGVKLDCTIIPGHQDHLQNNIVIARTPSGFGACMTGDQWHDGDKEWIFDLKGKIPPVDLLITHCWAYNLPEFVGAFSPRVAVTSHENELGHTADHREALWLSLRKAEATDPQCVVMTWGEILEL